MGQFKLDTNNTEFRPGVMSWICLSTLLLFYPLISVLGMGDDASLLLKSLNEGALIFLLITTILFQWTIYLINYGAVYMERTGLAGLQLRQIRVVDFAWGIAFLVAANLILAGLAWLLAQVGMPMSGDIQLLIPEDAFGRVIWIAVSFTAGFCEEIAFRGYLMTRIRLLGKFQNWVIPTIVSALAFGACHYYQGIPGLIIISVYGVLFSLLYIRTGRLWPCIIAHFFQDFSALIIPQ